MPVSQDSRSGGFKIVYEIAKIAPKWDGSALVMRTERGDGSWEVIRVTAEGSLAKGAPSFADRGSQSEKRAVEKRDSKCTPRGFTDALEGV